MRAVPRPRRARPRAELAPVPSSPPHRARPRASRPAVPRAGATPSAAATQAIARGAKPYLHDAIAKDAELLAAHVRDKTASGRERSLPPRSNGLGGAATITSLPGPGVEAMLPAHVPHAAYGHGRAGNIFHAARSPSADGTTRRPGLANADAGGARAARARVQARLCRQDAVFLPLATVAAPDGGVHERGVRVSTLEPHNRAHAPHGRIAPDSADSLRPCPRRLLLIGISHFNSAPPRASCLSPSRKRSGMYVIFTCTYVSCMYISFVSQLSRVLTKLEP
jgi:hypothetical protein